MIGTVSGVAESLTIDIKNNESPSVIVSNAVISAGFGALGGAGGSGILSSKKTYTTLGSAINSVKNATRPLLKKQATKILKKTVKKIGKKFLGETIEGFATDGIQFGTQKYMEGYFKYMGMAK